MNIEKIREAMRLAAAKPKEPAPTVLVDQRYAVGDAVLVTLKNAPPMRMTIKDARKGFGRWDYLVTAGDGWEKWVREEKIKRL